MGCVGFLIPLLAPFSLLASFCVLAGTGNSTTTLRYCIQEQNNCFFLAPNGVALSFLDFVELRQFRRSGLTFSRKLKVALMKFSIE